MAAAILAALPPITAGDEGTRPIDAVPGAACGLSPTPGGARTARLVGAARDAAVREPSSRGLRPRQAGIRPQGAWQGALPPGGLPTAVRAACDVRAVTLEQIETTLPCGFHDARVRRVEVDYRARSARIDLVLDAGDPQSEHLGDRDAWRAARLVLQDLLFVVFEPPATRPEAYAGEAWITSSGPATVRQREKLPPLPAGFFCHAFFASNWNAYLFAAAREATLTWA